MSTPDAEARPKPAPATRRPAARALSPAAGARQPTLRRKTRRVRSGDLSDAEDSSAQCGARLRRHRRGLSWPVATRAGGGGTSASRSCPPGAPRGHGRGAGCCRVSPQRQQHLLPARCSAASCFAAAHWCAAQQSAAGCAPTVVAQRSRGTLRWAANAQLWLASQSWDPRTCAASLQPLPARSAAAAAHRLVPHGDQERVL